MLVLSRKPSETVVIVCPNGDRITVMVIDIRGDKSRLGFEAPKEYRVHRSEVLDAIESEQAAQDAATA